MENYNKIVGDYGEGLACAYLERHGFRIIVRNIKISYQEIDIIAKIRGVIVFVEVKTRTNFTYGSADEAFSRAKMKSLRRAIRYYIEKKKIDENLVRLDLISVDIDKFKKVAKIKHYKEII